MLLLLDTHSLLWWIWHSPELGPIASTAIEDAENEIFVSPVSIYEISYKRTAGRLEAPEDLQRTMSDLGFVGLPVTNAHAERAGLLPIGHRDPFDRLLVAQAISEGLVLITADADIQRYDVPLLDARR